MEFRFWKSGQNSARNASAQNAVGQTSFAKSSTNTEREPLSVSPELERDINEALTDVNVAAAEIMHNQVFGTIKQVVDQLTHISNHMAGREIGRAFINARHDRIVLGFGDGTAISIKFEQSTLDAVDKEEGARNK